MLNRFILPKQIFILLALFTVLNIARYFIFDSRYFLFLFWNIFLAIIPFFISYFLLSAFNKQKLTKVLFVIGGIVWLLFLPNAPYIVTDLIHLGHNRTVPVLYDTFLLFTSAYVSMLLFFCSVSHLEKIFKSKYGWRKSEVILIVTMVLVSFGLYIGRFLRFNSWDLFHNPLVLLSKSVSVIAKPIENTNAFVFMGMSFIFIYVSYRAWKD